MAAVVRRRALHGLCALLLCWRGAAQALVVVFDPAAQTVPLGQQAVVAVAIEASTAGGPPSGGGYDIDVACDAGIVAIASVVFGGSLGPSLALADMSVPGLATCPRRRCSIPPQRGHGPGP